MILKRKRHFHFILLILVLILGLSSREYAENLPDYVNVYLGDAMWALMVYTLFGLLFKDLSIRKTGIAGFAFCLLIECSQLYHLPWIDAIRNTTLGGLVLGYGFLWIDLLAYTIGIVFGMLMEMCVSIFQRKHILFKKTF